MKKIHQLERMAPMQRRRFMKFMAAALAAPMVPSALRFGANAVAGGEAHAHAAEEALPRYFIEIILRDQWDLGHVMVAPSLAANPAARSPGDVAGLGQTALFVAADELTAHSINGTTVYLTNESRPLADLDSQGVPHLDSVAMIDLCEVTAGVIHGHESANPARSPGRGGAGPGRGPMFMNDGCGSGPGEEANHSSTPTPATMVNHWYKTVAPGLRNGVALKGSSRFQAMHFAAGLGAAAELDRHFSRDTLFNAFPEKIEDYNVLDRPEEAEAFAAVLERLDPRLLDRRGFSDAAVTAHGTQLSDVRSRLYQGEPRTISLPLTAEEVAFWSGGVPPQSLGPGVPAKADIWEQAGWTHKLVANDLCRSIVMEYDYYDIHDTRPSTALRTQATQVVYPLVRLIQRLKEASLYDRTTIALYTVDGSRTPDGAGVGGAGKNTVILAGGGIKGGYYGDIGYLGGADYSYAAPDEATGAPRPGVTDNGSRLSSAALWRTVIRAAGVPDDIVGQFPDVAGAAPLGWLLR